MPWTAETEAKLFSGCLQVLDLKLSKEDLVKLAEFLDNEFTPDAIRQHVTKKLAKGIISGNGGSANKIAGTPVKKTPKKVATPCSKRGVKKEVDSDENDDDALPATPSRKRASSRKTAKPVKSYSEQTDEEDNGDEDELQGPATKKPRLDDSTNGHEEANGQDGGSEEEAAVEPSTLPQVDSADGI
ncbi:uncharacterized protein K452DRAFT_359436 [Aplosporella prunicola CBS 121167]|uniref:Uncharacterized protein n=1 Tax=Aplosporella prunicola CBS 121167 TaxID=1176127 RepID=A0A6A6BCT2_9PEZI|nr:uncharacterized protein K452DRAFT_359436 [Aplosporella prunicola CBS 121167]KAF2141034.1 hypothetical protein K452DRAFT_359436 [Aplosporella prunicola CBS 121167]